MRNLKIDFYESGIGDTILINFPSGGMGLVDAHPSPTSLRSDILKIVEGRKLHFVCLTHPHADHGIDLVPVLEAHPDIESFWHTTSNVRAFIYRVEETPNFPSPVREFAARMNKDWANFLIDLFGAVAEKKIPRRQLRSDLQPVTIDGVEIHSLSPDEAILNRFDDAYLNKLDNPSFKPPDPNLLSAILALRFGESVVVLGADALRENWDSAVTLYHRRDLPKARIIKVPHHGARNSMVFQRHANSYLDICSTQAKAVLFAGDSKHPDREVYHKLRNRMEVFCLANGLKPVVGNRNPLNLSLHGALSVQASPVCNPVISFEVDKAGKVNLMAGNSCEVACFPKVTQLSSD